MKPFKMLDNKTQGKVVDELKENIRAHSKLSVVSAYFSIYAYAELKKELGKLDEFRFIFTKPTYVNKKKQAREYYINKKEDVSGTEFEIKLKNEIKQATIAKECAEWIKNKARFKSFKEENTAQPRLICLEGKEALAINGTPDFTTDGLGITPSNRVDFNNCMYGNEATVGLLSYFNELWDNNDGLEEVTDKLLQDMHFLYKENPPEFIYYITLYNIFYDYLDELTEDRIIKTKTGIKDTKIWNLLYQFQKDGVMGAIDKIEKYNGCILADSVGLGKTYSALAIIKYYELRNDRVLVLAPKRLRDNWTIYSQNDRRNILAEDRFSYDVLNHTDLSRSSGKSGDINLGMINWNNYDLIVIDESHNFRNNKIRKDKISRYQKLMNDVIKSGVKTKVLMLSATPVNNKMNDIKNQIAFITEGNNNALAGIGISNIEQTLRMAQLTYNRWIKFDESERTTKNFVDMMDLDYFKLLDTLTIARSRKHIEKYYDFSEMGEFPTRLKPKNLYSEIDSTGEFPAIGEVNKTIKKLKLAVYSPLSYVLLNKRAEYEKKYDVAVKDGQSKFRQIDRENSLVNLMRVNILKRMESSVHSFELTVEKLLNKIEFIIEKMDKKDIQYGDDLNLSDVDFDDSNLEDMIIGSNVKILLKDMDLAKWRQDLELDKENLEKILRVAKKVTPEKDQKFQDLKKLIIEKEKNPINKGNKKVIVFTAFADTAKYLYDNLADELKKKGLYSALITGSGVNKSTIPIPEGKTRDIKISDLNTVLTLFSPISKSCNTIFPYMKDEIDVVFATDCISEGQNLQDCDYLINYDIHWNPVRIIQRFGRIDRIGSKNKFIQLVNFWPTKDLNEYINLEERVQGRMVLLDVSATGEENIISDDEGMKDLQYRKKQLEQLQNEVVDLEDISGSISITDLTFSDFKIDLMEYMKKHRAELDNAKTGLYAIAKISKILENEIEPGVIFTLRQVEGASQEAEKNPIFPYYLIYITKNNEIKLTITQSKTILDYMKKICSGNDEVVKSLVDEFNKKTDDGNDMSMYSDLLKESIESIIGKKEEAGLESLFSKGGTSMDTKNFDGLEDFELLNFLILER